MPSQTLQVAQGLAIYKSDNSDIPYYAPVTSGNVNDLAVANKLVDADATFITSNVQIGNIVYNTTLGTSATVTSVDSQTTLTLSADIMAGVNAYVIYEMQNPDYGPVLYIGGTGDVRVTMYGGNILTFKAVPTGYFMPIHVKKLWSTGTTATDIIALW